MLPACAVAALVSLAAPNVIKRSRAAAVLLSIARALFNLISTSSCFHERSFEPRLLNATRTRTRRRASRAPHPLRIHRSRTLQARGALARAQCSCPLVRPRRRAVARTLAHCTSRRHGSGAAARSSASRPSRRAARVPPHAALSVAAQGISFSREHAPRAHAQLQHTHAAQVHTACACAARPATHANLRALRCHAPTMCATAAAFGGAVRAARPRRCSRRMHRCLVTRASAGLRPGAARTARKAATHLFQHTFAAAT